MKRHQLSDSWWVWEEFVNLTLVALRQVLRGLPRYFSGYVLHQDARRGELLIAVESRDVGLLHVIAFKVSRRMHPIPPSLCELYFNRFWRRVSRIFLKNYGTDLLARADFSVYLVARLTDGARKFVRITRRLNRSTVFERALCYRYTTIKHVVRRFVSDLMKYYASRLKAIQLRMRQLEERGYTVRNLRIGRLAHVLLRLIDAIQQGAERLGLGISVDVKGWEEISDEPVPVPDIVITEQEWEHEWS